jgi:hypothetical protein
LRTPPGTIFRPAKTQLWPDRMPFVLVASKHSFERVTTAP